MSISSFSLLVHARWLAALLAALSLLALLAPAPVAAQTQTSQFFPETGHTVSGDFLTFWQNNGGLPIFGLPISDLQGERDPVTGSVQQVQWFERARFEYHPENQPPYNVLLALLGSEGAAPLRGDAAFQPVADPGDPNVTYFAATQHTLAGQFQAFWQSNGGLPVFGYPLSEPFVQLNPTDGKMYQVQWFERARLELHPQNPPASQVLLGLLGVQFLRQSQANRPLIALSAGGKEVTIEQNGTALLPAGGDVTVTISYPPALFPQQFGVQLHQIASGSPWQVVPSGRAPVQNSHLFALRPASDSPNYIQVEADGAPGQPAIFFGVQLASRSGGPPLIANWNDPLALVYSYYNAINRGEYARAYSYWEQPGRPNGVAANFSDFVAGYANTAAVSLTFGDAVSNAGAGNVYFSVPVVLLAGPKVGSPERFFGCYTLHRINVEVGDTTPPYPIALSTANISVAPAGSDTPTLLAQATALAQSGQCGQ